MAIFIDPEGQYPRYIGDIQISNSSWEYGDPLPDGWIEVVDKSIPEQRPGYVLAEDFPVLVSNQYTRSWKFIKKTENQINAENKHLQEMLTEKNISGL